MKIEQRPIASVKPYPGNPRQNDKAVDAVARSIKEFGFRVPIVVDRQGENVLDLFGGSGSTLIGAEMTGRRAYLMELDELYCDVIVQRWEAFTGKKATRVPGNGAAEEKAPAKAEA